VGPQPWGASTRKTATVKEVDGTWKVSSFNLEGKGDVLTRTPLRPEGAGLAGLVRVALLAAPTFAGDGTRVMDCSQSTPQNPEPGCDATAKTGDNNSNSTGGAGGQQPGDGICRNGGATSPPRRVQPVCQPGARQRCESQCAVVNDRGRELTAW
jgi:hypothetical protein